MSAEILVIGAGIAGFSAALRLKNQGKSVRILTKSGGASSLSSGSWDFGPTPSSLELSYTSLRQTSQWKDCFRKLLADRFEIPALSEITSATNEWRAALKPQLSLNFDFQKGFEVPTTSGRWKRTFGLQDIQARADLSLLKGKRIGVVASDHWRFRADLLTKKWSEAVNLRAQEPLDIAPFWIDLKISGADWPIPHLATKLLVDETFRNQLRLAVEQRLHGSHFDVLIFPPIFLDLDFAEQLQADLHITIAECAATTEPIPGQRLTRAIRASLQSNDIELIETATIEPLAANHHIQKLKIWKPTKREWSELSAEHFVLATGKHFGGGIELGYENVRETTFGLPVFQSRDGSQITQRHEIDWTQRPSRDEQSWTKLGIWVDESFRPVGPRRTTAFDNLTACGSVLGGVDFAKENMGLGVMATLGRRAADAAC